MFNCSFGIHKVFSSLRNSERNPQNSANSHKYEHKGVPKVVPKQMNSFGIQLRISLLWKQREQENKVQVESNIFLFRVFVLKRFYYSTWKKLNPFLDPRLSYHFVRGVAAAES